jgi:hypothetical protein
MVSLADQIAGLAQLSPAQLRAEWRRLHRGQSLPQGMSTDLMTRVIAWRLQEKAFGGLPSARLRELVRLAKQLETTGELDLERQRQLKPGTRLVRQWNGNPHTVTVLEQGYEFEERHYASLTPIARQITGAAWSGPRFFGLQQKAGSNEPQG